MTPTQIKLATWAGAALLVWWLTRTPPAPGARVTKEVLIGANVLDPDTFGLTDDEIAARKANPAVDPEMHRLIDLSNALLSADDRENGT
jgi:hypothetical protein